MGISVKPNRAFIFAGREGVTWHSYGHWDKTTRVTINYFKKYLNHNLIINKAQIQVWIPGSYSILHTHDEDGRGRKDTYWNSLIYLNDVDDGGEFYTENGITIRPRAGTLTLFDGKNVKHGLKEVKNNNRYTIILWWN